MAQYYGAPPNQGDGACAPDAQNLRFYSTTYGQVPPHAGYGYNGGGAQPALSFGAPNFGGGFGVGGFGSGGATVVHGRMGEGRGGLSTGLIAAFSTEGYEGEPPLLEELGVNFGHIRTKTLAVLNPFARIDQHLYDDSDLAGPLLFFVLLGTFLLLSGKVHFGYIYGLAIVGSIVLHLVLALMTPTDGDEHDRGHAPPPYGDGTSTVPEASSSASALPGAGAGALVGHGGGGHLSSTLTFLRSTSVLGYCLLPLVATSMVGIVIPMDTPLGIALTSAAILWCTCSASAMFCVVGRMRAMIALVAYPLALFYVGFGIMAVFSSRGSGMIDKATAAKAAGAAA